MLLEKPGWLVHENTSGTKCAIYGIDAQPSGNRLATCGGDNTVKIWSTEFFFTDESTGSTTSAENRKPLVTLSWHQHAVNCVRWSHNGRYLASGSDDHFVMIYELQQGKKAIVPFGANTEPNAENWENVATLKGHSMNVEDVAFSPDDRILATCSIDNSILIWAVGANNLTTIMSHPLRKLTGHNSWVKGLTWDPVGKYLASASEDKTVIIWKVEDWSIEKRVREPYQDSASSSYFRRLSWSPDGASLCTTNGFKSKQEVAPLLERNTWKNEIDLVGHRKVVSTVRFNPHLFAKNEEKTTEKYFSCCAVGGDDCTISIWLTQVARPLAIIKESFDSSITDMTWSSCGYTLYSVSLDGTVCGFRFKETEIGRALRDDEQSRLLSKKYGSRQVGSTLGTTLVENPLQLGFEGNGSMSPSPMKNSGARQLSKKPAKRTVSQTAPSPSKQTESKSKSGKRRIQPMLMSIDNTNHSLPEKQITSSSIPPTAKTPEKQSSPIDVTTFSPVDLPQVGSQRTPSSDFQHSPEPSALSPAAEPSPLSILNAKRTRQDSDVEETKSSPVKVRRMLKTNIGSSSSSIISSSTHLSAASTRLKQRQQLMPMGSLSVDILPHPPTRAQLVCQVSRMYQKEAVDLIIEANVQNVQLTEDHSTIDDDHHDRVSLIPKGPVYSSITCRHSAITLWSDQYPGRITGIAANGLFTAVSIADGSLYILSETGKRLFPCIVLGDTVSVLEVGPTRSACLLVITVKGKLKMWNILSKTLLMSESIESITQGISIGAGLDNIENNSSSLIRARVTAQGHPILSFAVTEIESESKHIQSYTYDANMSCWMRVADDSFSFSDFHSILPTNFFSDSKVPTGPLTRLQNASANSRSSMDLSKTMLSNLSTFDQRCITKSHLENEMSSAEVLKSPQEYQYWLKMYAKYLSTDGDEIRLRELFSELLGPMSATKGYKGTNEYEGWKPTILGLHKRRLLKTILLPIVAQNRSLQRLIAEFQSRLDRLSSNHSQESSAAADLADLPMITK